MFQRFNDRNHISLLIEILPASFPKETLGLSPLAQNRKNRDRHANYYIILNSK